MKLHELSEEKLRAETEISGLKDQITTKLCPDWFKQNKGHLKFYKEFETYEMFNDLIC